MNDSRSAGNQVCSGEQANGVPLEVVGGRESPQSPTLETIATSAVRTRGRSIDFDGGTSPPDSAVQTLDRAALCCLILQHISSSWNYRSVEFAVPVYLVSLFPNTLAPASIYGICLLLSSLAFSPAVGKLVDHGKIDRLATVRKFIIGQKSSITISYAIFVILQTLDARSERTLSSSSRWGAFVLPVCSGAIGTLFNTGVSIAVERDWVSVISQGQERLLVRLNSILRRIDLLSKLLAPLFVSLLVATTSNRTSAIILFAMNTSTLIFEWIWIAVVYSRFTALSTADREESQRRRSADETATEHPGNRVAPAGAWHALVRVLRTLRLSTIIKSTRRDVGVFLRLPTLPTSIALALLYTSVLSFDSTFLTYLLQPHPSALSAGTQSSRIFTIADSSHGNGPLLISYKVPFVTGMRALCVICGLVGTFCFPWMNPKIGLSRLGSWSLFFEFAALTPSIIALWVGVGKAWNTAALFTGMALSRIGLWCYDLTQLTILQQTLLNHPEASMLFGTQSSLLALFDLSHFAMTLIWSRPSEFKIPAAISYALIGVAWVLFTGWYVRRERGHLVHFEKIPLLGAMRPPHRTNEVLGPEASERGDLQGPPSEMQDPLREIPAEPGFLSGTANRPEWPRDK